MIGQTWAILVDSYRELHSKKLFWISLLISALCVLVFAGVGINERGITLLAWTIPNPLFNTNFWTPAAYYKWVFVNFGIQLWLAWIATILALISTAPIFPDFLAGGAVEMVISKPIGRVRLFLTKYFAALIFVGVQVLVFCGLCMIMLGIRGGSWEPKLLLAVPLVLAFFSFLYCLCALFGVLTRSTIASLLLTFLVWLMLFAMNAGDAAMVFGREYFESRVESLEKIVPRRERAAQNEADRLKEDKLALEEGREPVTPSPRREHTQAELFAANPLLERGQRELEESKKDLKQLRFWHGILIKVKTPLPKTTETIELLERTILTPQEIQRFSTAVLERQRERELQRRKIRGTSDDDSLTNAEVQAQAEQALRSRSLWWVLGTSFAFESVVLAFACWRFARRDF
jgi:ABC-type transport system involved in multi-copper enzyme maturation permease subunit